MKENESLTQVEAFKEFENQISELSKAQIKNFRSTEPKLTKEEFKENLKGQIYVKFREFTNNIGLGDEWNIDEENIEKIEQRISEYKTEGLEEGNKPKGKLLEELINGAKAFNSEIDIVCEDAYKTATGKSEEKDYGKSLKVAAKMIGAAAVGFLTGVASAIGITLIASSFMGPFSAVLLPVTVPVLACFGMKTTIEAVLKSEDKNLEKELTVKATEFSNKIGKATNTLKTIIEASSELGSVSLPMIRVQDQEANKESHIDRNTATNLNSKKQQGLQ